MDQLFGIFGFIWNLIDEINYSEKGWVSDSYLVMECDLGLDKPSGKSWFVPTAPSLRYA